MKRKLASVQKIHNITPIDGADRIECVHVLGWRCVAKKGEFNVGDLCVYFEIDSFLPIEEDFEFLRDSSYKKSDILGEGFRLRTVTMRGQISQGLALPISILSKRGVACMLGDDVTDILGVRKFEIAERGTSEGTIKGILPYSIPKTDDIRVQSMPQLIEQFKGKPYYITTKLDGTSMTVFLSEERFGVCGHQYEFKDDSDVKRKNKSSMWEYAVRNNIEQRMRDAGMYGIAFQGEYCGPGIQKNPLKLTKPDFFVFNAVSIDTGRTHTLEGTKQLCELAGLKMVPIEEEGDSFSYASVDELLERAKGEYESGRTKEGIVIRTKYYDFCNEIGKSLSMKVINNDYLIGKKGRKNGI